MTQQARAPRQRPGEPLRSFTLLLPPALYEALTTLAATEQRSRSQVGRLAIEAYVTARTATPVRLVPLESADVWPPPK
jgi:hypothetical protein